MNSTTTAGASSRASAPAVGSAADAPAEFVLTLDCVESPGIVHSVSEFLLARNCYIKDILQFGDQTKRHFFMRVQFSAPAGTTSGDLRTSFEAVAQQWAMSWRLEPQGRKQRILVMVSKYGHCLNDLLFRARNGELPVEIVAVVSNHRDHEGLVDWHGILFHHIPVTKDTKPQAEAELMALVDSLDVELVVLARYMQVLSEDLTKKLEGRAINIHHSFLPSFKGAKPYHQAYERGVKTVGATAHYVNSELDEGPIIAQQVIEVDHTYGPEDLVTVGRDAECKALTNAVRWHAEGRIILSGNRTVVLR
ncbi:Formyltetrahydrofolate deformylase [Arthrobacter ulcerisalmonis]|uniref:Formyltetrahydrofolate deformylase n=1 Tax=Arthrobacter ulcerisalmonis TaxID=2483813 RepID=A0A3P5XDZ0_9MICC|nr:formyltetrahydrofolate deformylase [Arthrobacter ulcerisalmonis]VDC28471.1 Formyltetrahydrofolate deformylase [Arthrobacter ulcerisalmonis]